MRLKCIGGPNDGKYDDVVGKHIGRGEKWRVPILPKMSAANYTLDYMPEPTLDHVIYIIDELKYNSHGRDVKTWHFLRYAEISIEEIFDKVLL